MGVELLARNGEEPLVGLKSSGVRRNGSRRTPFHNSSINSMRYLIDSPKGQKSLILEAMLGIIIDGVTVFLVQEGSVGELYNKGTEGVHVVICGRGR